MTRRVFIRNTGKATLMVVTFSMAGGLRAAAGSEPTPPNTAGPFYSPGAPLRNDLREPGVNGSPLFVSGRVTNTMEKPIPGAKIEIWHTDPSGKYDMNGHRYRATIPVGSSGEYEFRTYFPAAYSGRPQHIHYKITAPGTSPLTTQLYFESDPFFKGDPQKTYTNDSIIGYRQLIRPVEASSVEARVFFQIVLKESV